MLNEQQRKVYGAMADVLIPAAEGMPSATQADVPTRWVDEALRHRPDLAEGLLVAIRAAENLEAEAAVEKLNSEHIPAFEAMGTLTAGAYFLNPSVRELLGYPGQVSTIAKPDLDDYADLLENVVERGQLYREAPETSTEDA